ncbi:hypothetical protein LAUMK191_02355 [Mycobacterium attenuatum]|uniref:Uncharacterized protein n=1 Tax=Mycobacterium attenuatum TaxID=2341086 RepID=A0A498Q301_9MYCO|nr:hypothetical protein LAUMK136_02354 [Mycobacterium attenuatum]VBA52053.1 hypothetical protein LAUMK191_02355 [Mycobacterium attenuatum]VBA57394.1 hypothetical protein LAUMK41_02439 [Mycobacterium attenuatum]
MLTAVGPNLVAVILEGDVVVLPADVQMGFYPTPFIACSDLRLRAREAGGNQHQRTQVP